MCDRISLHGFEIDWEILYGFKNSVKENKKYSFAIEGRQYDENWFLLEVISQWDVPIVERQDSFDSYLISVRSWIESCRWCIRQFKKE